MRNFIAFVIVSMISVASFASSRILPITKDATINVQNVTAIQYTSTGEFVDIKSGAAKVTFEVKGKDVTIKMVYKDRDIYVNIYHNATLQVHYDRTNVKPSYLITSKTHILTSVIYCAETGTYSLCPYAVKVK